MGLDMSLRIKRKSSQGRPRNNEFEKPVMRIYYSSKGEALTFDLPDYKTGKLGLAKKPKKPGLFSYSEVVYELAYWRKANAIHKWFVDNVQNGNDNCEDYFVTSRQLKDLYNTVCDVLEHCELKKGKVKNGYTIKKFLWKTYRKYNKVNGKVLTKKSIKYCAEHLPTQDGFFFGNTQYNEYYYEDLVYTKERLEYILKKYDVDTAKIYYTSSW